MRAGAALFLVACGGRIAGDDGGIVEPQPSVEAAPSDVQSEATGPAFPVCPPHPPGVGTSCYLTPPNNGCAYFTYGSCSAYVCSSGTWSSASCP
jgi:hypothetical protein